MCVCVCVPVSVCLLEDKARPRTKDNLYNLTINLNDTEHSLIEPNHAEHTTTHYQPPRCSISQPTQSLFLGVGHSLSHRLLNSLLSPLSLPRKIDSPNLRACRAAADGEDLVSPFTGSNQAINDKKACGSI